eukprot:8880765-Alexandrium_andersonii.AAC.1
MGHVVAALARGVPPGGDDLLAGLRLRERRGASVRGGASATGCARPLRSGWGPWPLRRPRQDP